MDKKHLKRLKELGETYKKEWEFLCEHRVWMDNILEQDPAELAILAVVLIAGKRNVHTWAEFKSKILDNRKSPSEYDDDGE